MRWTAGLRFRSCIAALVVLAALGGCASGPRVQPWQREKLAAPKMLIAPDHAAQVVEQHVYEYREGSAGGYGTGGGGCGCN